MIKNSHHRRRMLKLGTITQEQKRIKLAEAAGWRLFSQFKNLWAPPKHVVEYDCDALSEYESVLKNVAKHGKDGLKNDAKWVLKRHKIKK